MIKKSLEMLLAPPLAFLFFLVVFYLLIFWPDAWPQGQRHRRQAKTYHCGEDIPGGKPALGYKLSCIALSFHHARGGPGRGDAAIGSDRLSGPVYLGMIFLAVLALITRNQHD